MKYVYHEVGERVLLEKRIASILLAHPDVLREVVKLLLMREIETYRVGDTTLRKLGILTDDEWTSE